MTLIEIVLCCGLVTMHPPSRLILLYSKLDNYNFHRYKVNNEKACKLQ